MYPLHARAAGRKAATAASNPAVFMVDGVEIDRWRRKGNDLEFKAQRLKENANASNCSRLMDNLRSFNRPYMLLLHDYATSSLHSPHLSDSKHAEYPDLILAAKDHHPSQYPHLIRGTPQLSMFALASISPPDTRTLPSNTLLTANSRLAKREYVSRNTWDAQSQIPTAVVAWWWWT